MSRPFFLVAVLGLTACSGTRESQFDDQHHYLPHDHASHYINHEPLGPLAQPQASPRHSQDGVPMRMSAGTRSAYLPAAGPSLVGGQTQLQQHISALAYRLVSSAHQLNDRAGIAVSGFVDQQDYRTQDDFGRLLSETMMFQLNQYGLRVVDFKTLPFIRITPDGDVSTSRDYRQLSSRIGARYLLHGTVSETTGGRLINARLVSMGDNSLVASAQQFIPEYLVASAIRARGPQPRMVMTPEQRSRYAK
ncbi:FlgO family outer membrane protein [Oceanisphaera sp. KMM 10153]|uniref:FlgO family outer membrane protein n=1 Tax=Oceanisphaera submarina TaxID=3390193 RepID=UPI003976168A